MVRGYGSDLGLFQGTIPKLKKTSKNLWYDSRYTGSGSNQVRSEYEVHHCCCTNLLRHSVRIACIVKNNEETFTNCWPAM